jgi:outer membrane protein assembly factor BamB
MRPCLALLFALLSSPALSAADWTQWRGPGRDGTVAAGNAPESWPETLTPRWRVEVGEGYASPVTASGRVFVLSRQDPEEVVTAVDLASGKVLWQQRYRAVFEKNQYAVEMAKGPNSTPLLADGHLFTLGVTGVLSAWSPESGELLWRNDYSAAVDTSKLFCGTAMSPLLEDGSLIVQVGSDVHDGRFQPTPVWKSAEIAMYMSSPVFRDGTLYGHVRTRKGQFVAVDAATGTLRWATEGREGEHASVLLTPSHVLFLTNGADLVVARPGGEKFDPVRRYDIAGGATWAVPMPLPDGLLLRDATGLVRVGKGE